jgi:5-hydroxyisourate hydrolase-like protein (transthyretin family)
MDEAVSGVPVTVGVIDPGSAVTPLATVSTDANGRATFSGLTITGVPGAYFLDFTAPAYTENAVPVTVSAAP